MTGRTGLHAGARPGHLNHEQNVREHRNPQVVVVAAATAHAWSPRSHRPMASVRFDEQRRVEQPGQRVGALAHHDVVIPREQRPRHRCEAVHRRTRGADVPYVDHRGAVACIQTTADADQLAVGVALEPVRRLRAG
jgi:hypothetical protein